MGRPARPGQAPREGGANCPWTESTGRQQSPARPMRGRPGLVEEVKLHVLLLRLLLGLGRGGSGGAAAAARANY